MTMETPYTSLRSDILKKDFRPLQGDLHVSQEILDQIRLRHPDRLEISQEAIKAYFLSAFHNYCEVCYRPEIKSGRGDISEPPMLVGSQSVSGVSASEQQAFQGWMSDQVGGRTLAEIQAHDLQHITREIQDFLSRRRPVDSDDGDAEADDPGDAGGVLSPGSGGDDEDEGVPDEVWVSDDEGEVQVERNLAYEGFYSAVIDNRLIFESQESKRRYEEILTAIRTGKIQNAGELLLGYVFLELEQLNTKMGLALAFKTEGAGKFDRLLPSDNSPLTATDQIKLNIETQKYYADASQVNFLMQKFLNDKERLVTMAGNLRQKMGEFGQTVNQAIARAGG